MKVALAQMAPRLGDPDANLEKHLDLVRKARRGGAELVVFPELSLTGYMLQDLVPEMAEEARTGKRLEALARATKGAGGAAVVAGFVERGPGLLHHNAAACFAGGSLLHVHRKVYLPTYGMFDEGRYFAPGGRFRAFDAPWGRTGMLVCEDFWHLSAPYLLALQGLDLLIVISAGPVKAVDASAKLRSRETWVDLGRVVSRHLSCFVVHVNRTGVEEGWTFIGGSYACDPTGLVLAEAKILEEDLVVADLPSASLRKARLAFPLLRDEKVDLTRRELERILWEDREAEGTPAGEAAPRTPRASGESG